MTNAEKAIRLSKLAREFNVGISTLVDFLSKKGHNIESNPNTKVDASLYQVLAKEFGAEINLKKESQKVSLQNLREKKESVSIDADAGEDEVIVKNVNPEKETYKTEKPQISLKVKGKIDLEKSKKEPEPPAKKEETPEQPKEEAKPQKPAVEHIETEKQKLEQPKVLGKMNVDELQKRKPTKKHKKAKEVKPSKPESKPAAPKADEKPTPVSKKAKT